MNAKFRLVNGTAFFRLALVGVLSIGATYLLAMVASNSVDLIYRATNYSTFWSTVFYSLSQYRVPLGFLMLLLGVVLFGGWIMAPIFADFTEVVSASLSLEDGTLAIKLPKSLKGLQDRLEAVHKELLLWQYAAREAEQRKDDLVVYLAHDIRTPLTSILGYLELVTEHPELPEESKQNYTSIALRKAQRMQGLVEELFEITRFNVSQTELNKQKVNAAVFVNQLAEETAPLFAERNITVTVENRGIDSLFIDGDKMARAIENILQNAARYTPEGETVHILLDSTADEKTRIAISNSGHEISQSQLDRFFEKFYRGDEARQTSTGGSGLGLAIAKNLVEAHGGSISAENRENVTTFTILI